MRFEKGHKAATRRHILDVASRCFRREGISAAGISGIMGEAGLTNGAFYPHFGSKEELVREALANVVAEHQHRLEENLQAGLDLENVIRSYLSLAHREEGACGCPSAALLPEIARQPRPTRKAYADGLRTFVSTLAALLPDADFPAAGRRATAIFALMVGTLQFARATPDVKHAKQILENGVQAALLLARAPSA
jgi:TetR/AcrR family transcriptional regulator, transcriptional repressor for nem operon